MDTKPKLTAAASTVQLIDLTSHRLVIKSRQQQKKYTQFNQVEMSPFPFQPINTTVLPFGLF